jgi:4-hydroxybenzoate polyprenyltransferase
MILFAQKSKVSTQDVRNVFQNIFSLLRAKSWLKNILILIPVSLGWQITSSKLVQVIILIVVINLTASATYIFNDLIDLKTDQTNPEKTNGIITAGQISKKYLTLIIFGLSLVAILLPVVLDQSKDLVMMVGYLFLSVTYTLWVKTFAIADVFYLAFFYVYRIIIGGIVTETKLTPWLIVASYAFFLSFSFLKRANQVRSDLDAGIHVLRRTRYSGSADLLFLQVCGLSASFGAMALVAVFSVQQIVIPGLYKSPEYLYALPLLSGYTMISFWLNHFRGKITRSDPLEQIFRVDILTALAMTAVLFALSHSGLH